MTLLTDRQESHLVRVWRLVVCCEWGRPPCASWTKSWLPCLCRCAARVCTLRPVSELGGQSFWAGCAGPVDGLSMADNRSSGSSELSWTPAASSLPLSQFARWHMRPCPRICEGRECDANFTGVARGASAAMHGEF